MRETTYMECSCGSMNHVVRFSDIEGESSLSVSYHLNNHRPWWRRLWQSLKHIWGGSNIYGDWDETLLGTDEVCKLRDLCDRFLGRNQCST